MLAIVVLIFGTKKLRNIGEDLGGAVKGFKSGMKDGSEPAPEAPPKVADRVVDKSAIDVEARDKTRY